MRSRKPHKHNIAALMIIAALLAIVGCSKEEKEPSSVAPIPLAPGTAVVSVQTKDEPATQALETKEHSGSTKDITTLEEALKAGVPVVVKLGSDKCYPCRLMAPIIKELAKEQDGKAVFLDLDVYENKELAAQAEVRVIPTILFFDKTGTPKAKAEGFMSKEDLLKAIEELELN